MKCIVEGCTGEYRPGRRENGGTGSRRMCNAHYLRVKRRGTTELAPRPSILERFWAKVDRSEPDGCWLWSGPLNNNGYGRFTLEFGRRGRPDVRLLAHRFAYTLTTAEDLTGRVLMHSCDNPPCVNPAHLTAGTQLDNVRDMHTKGRADISGLAVRHGIDRTRKQREKRSA